LLFLDIYATIKIIPIKLHPIDNPINKPLLNSPKLLVSFPVKIVNAKYNKLPKIIRNVPVLIVSF